MGAALRASPRWLARRSPSACSTALHAAVGKLPPVIQGQFLSSIGKGAGGAWRRGHGAVHHRRGRRGGHPGAAERRRQVRRGQERRPAGPRWPRPPCWVRSWRAAGSCPMRSAALPQSPRGLCAGSLPTTRPAIYFKQDRCRQLRPARRPTRNFTDPTIVDPQRAVAPGGRRETERAGGQCTLTRDSPPQATRRQRTKEPPMANQEEGRRQRAAERRRTSPQPTAPTVSRCRRSHSRREQIAQMKRGAPGGQSASVTERPACG